MTIDWIIIGIIWVLTFLYDVATKSENKGAILMRDIMILLSVGAVLTLKLGL